MGKLPLSSEEARSDSCIELIFWELCILRRAIFSSSEREEKRLMMTDTGSWSSVTSRVTSNTPPEYVEGLFGTTTFALLLGDAGTPFFL